MLVDEMETRITERGYTSTSEYVKDALTVYNEMMSLDTMGDPVVELKARFVKSMDEVLTPVMEEMMKKTAALGVVVGQQQRAAAAIASRPQIKTPVTYAASQESVRFVESVEPVVDAPIELKHETTVARTPQQAKEERANEIRRNFPTLLISYIRTKEDSDAKKVIERKLQSDLERLWRYIDEPHRDDYISELNDHLLVYYKLNDKLMDETGISWETMRAFLERFVRNDPTFSPRRTPVAEMTTLPDDMAQRIKLERA